MPTIKLQKGKKYMVNYSGIMVEDICLIPSLKHFSFLCPIMKTPRTNYFLQTDIKTMIN